MLKSDGIFVANFAGAGSLASLKKILLLLEQEYNQKHIPHVSPFIKIEYVNFFLQQAGFLENIIDLRPIILEYNSPLDLMYALKKIGESNCLKDSIAYSINKMMYKELEKKITSKFIDHIQLITFIAARIKHTIRLK